MSSIYPIKIATTSMSHKGGTKRYFITTITRNDGMAMNVFRFGPMRSWGQINTGPLQSESSALREADKKLREKSSGGYQIVPGGTHGVADSCEATDYDMLIKVLGRTMVAAMGVTIKQIDPGAPISGDARGQAHIYDEDGNRPAAPTHDAWKEEERRIAEEKQKAEEAERNQMQSLPNYGMF